MFIIKKKMEEIQVESKYYLMNGLNAIKTVYIMTISLYYTSVIYQLIFLADFTFNG